MKRLLAVLAILVAATLIGCASTDSGDAAPFPGIEPNPTPIDPVEEGGSADGGDGFDDGAVGGGDDSFGDTGGPGGDGTDGAGEGEECVPICEPGWECGPDGCGGVCGTCPDGESCNNATHMCVPSGQLEPPQDGGFGPNGECLPQCTGKQCGPDGCGGSCGWCGGDDSCQEGACVTVEGCTPDCAGKMIGVDDGCGGVCSGSGFGIGLVPGGAQDAAFYRSKVMAGEVPTADLLPIEGWLNEHGTALPPPLYDRLVTLHGFVGLFYDPAEGEPTVALQLGMNSGLSPESIEQGRFNLSVVIDRSGSMADDGKMDFVKAGLVEMLNILDGDDLLSIVTYSTVAKVALEPTPVTEENKAAILTLIDELTTGGKTNLHSGLKLGYEQVMKNAAQNDMTPRVVLLSDGIANEGETDSDVILASSKTYNDVGIGVTTIGVGQDLQFDLLHLLASQGSGNFYYLDTAEKLQQVFSDELEYLLTPVADNLQVYFTLPDGFGVEDVYGFEYKNTDGEFHLLGPSPQYTISDGEVIDDPPEGGEEPNVAVSTLFASKKNGLLMVKLSAPDVSLIEAQQEAALSTVHYSYDLVDTGETEAFDVEIGLGSLEYENSGGFGFFSGAIMQKNFCVLRLGLAMKSASALFHDDPDNGIQGAITVLAQARTFCEGINVQLNDADIVTDVTLLETLMDNLCGEDCLEPGGQ